MSQNKELIKRFHNLNALDETELYSLKSAFKKENVPEYVFEIIDSAILAEKGDASLAAQKLVATYWRLVNSDSYPHEVAVDIFGRFIHTFILVQKSAKDINVIHKNWDSLLEFFLDVTETACKHGYIARHKISLFCMIGSMIYRSPKNYEELRVFASSWKGVASFGTESVGAMAEEFLVTDWENHQVGTLRFFPHLLSYTGCKDAVIQFNTCIGKISQKSNWQPNRVEDSVTGYANDNVFQRETRRFCDLLINDINFDTVLDVGCGPGEVGKNISQQRKSISLIGIELNPDYASYARSNGAYDTVINGDAYTELKKLEQQFDLITLCMVLDYIPARALSQEVTKVLKPGGFLAFSFIPAREDFEDVCGHVNYYQSDLHISAYSNLTVIKSIMAPYMWTGGYYVLLQKDV